MKRFLRRLSAYPRPVLWALALFILVSCILDGDKTAKRGSEVENEIYGVLVAMDGNPVAGAKVKAVPSTAQIAKMGSPRAPGDSDSVWTDGRGRYSLRGLAPGRYNLFGSNTSATLVVLIPEVDHMDTTSPEDQGVDTLRAPGRIRGRLLLGGRGKEGIIAYIPGTNFLAVSDDSGRFILDGIPKGTYAVRYTAPRFLIDPDSGVKVGSGETVELPDKGIVYDPAEDPPAPEGLTADYDTLSGTVTLSWDSVQAPDLAGYLVYRDTAKSTRLEPSLLEDRLVFGTSQIDWVGADRPEPVDVIYRVRARDQQANTGPFSKPLLLRLVPGSQIRTTARVYSNEKHGFGQASPGDTIPLIIEFGNPGRKIREVRWIFGSLPDTSWVRTVLLSSHEGKDTLMWVPERLGRANLSVILIDETGMSWTAAGLGSPDLPLEVVPDTPQADAGTDTTVSIGDTLLLRGKGSDRFGHIMKWEWDVGGEGWFVQGGPDTSIQVPALPTPGYLCILKVTDDDGQSDMDTMIVRIVRDEPTVYAGLDREASIGDAIRLTATAKDEYGRITKYEWDAGATGEFQPAGPETTVTAPQKPQAAFPVVVRVTDDDGLASADTLYISVLADAPVAVSGFEFGNYFTGEFVKLTSRESRDRYGSIVSREWDPGAVGNFHPSGIDTAIAFPLSAGDFPVVLRITDDDGMVSLDTVFIKVHESGGKVWFKSLMPLVGSQFFEPEMVEFKDRLWLLGGTGNASILASTDGLTWSAVAPTPFGSGLIYHTATVFNDEIWVIGGSTTAGVSKAVWHSPDGISWTRAPDLPFGPVAQHAAVVLSGKLYLIGGQENGNYKLGIWQTSDGRSWTKVAATIPQERITLVTAAVLNGKAFVFTTDTSPSKSVPCAIWSSDDGVTWAKIADGEGIPFDYPMNNPVVVADERMWLPFIHGLHSSSDGRVWATLEINKPDEKKIYQNGAAAFRGRIWVIGGFEDSPPTINYTKW